MRKLAALVALSLIFSFTCGYLLIVVQQSLKRTIKPELISIELRRLLREADGSQLKISFDQYEEDLLNPAFALPQTVDYSRADLQTLEKYRTTCAFNEKGRRPISIAKAIEFYDIICAKKTFKPLFFTRKPFMLPSGESFSSVALKNGYKNEEILHYLHLTERAAYETSELSGILADFEWRSWNQVYRKSRVVLTPQWALVRANFIEDDLAYTVFPISQWNSFWSRTAFKAVPYTSDLRTECFSVSEKICWSVQYLKAVQYQSGTEILLLCGLLFVTLILFFLLLLEVVHKRRDNEKIKFSLDMLTHELRTPLTQMNFNIEKLRGQFDQLPDAAQLGLLDTMNQVQRLNQLARNSTHYLSASATGNFKIQAAEVNDIEAYVKHCLDLYLDEIELSFVTQSTSFKTDPFWLGVCLKNIVENALKHGQKPVRVLIDISESEMCIEVSDAGVFKKRQKKSTSAYLNLGLGLNLVRKILKELGGRLDIQTEPTVVKMKVQKYDQ